MDGHESTGRGHIALDCSWVDAVVMIIGMVLCSLFAVGLLWTTLNRHWQIRPISYLNAVFFIVLAALVLYSAKDRTIRFGFAVLLASDAGRVAVSLVRAPFGVQRAAILVDRWMMLAFCAGTIVYIALWFKRRIRVV